MNSRTNTSDENLFGPKSKRPNGPVIVEPPAVSLDRVTAGYGSESIVEDVTFSLEPGSFTAIVGPSGAGKTTLLRLIAGTLTPASGVVEVFGRPPGRRSGSGAVAYVSQVDSVDWHFPVTVRETISMGMAARSGPWPWTRRSDRAEIASIAEELGIGELLGRHIHELSGGQQQRVFMARALVARSRLLLLDEPTSGVDIGTRVWIIDFLHRLHESGTTILLTTHDLNSVAALIPNLICFNRKVVAIGSPDTVFTPENLEITFSTPMVVLDHDGRLVAVEIPDEAHGHHVHIHHEHQDV